MEELLEKFKKFIEDKRGYDDSQVKKITEEEWDMVHPLIEEYDDTEHSLLIESFLLDIGEFSIYEVGGLDPLKYKVVPVGKPLEESSIYIIDTKEKKVTSENHINTLDLQPELIKQILKKTINDLKKYKSIRRETGGEIC